MSPLLLAKVGSFAQKYWTLLAIPLLLGVILLLTYCAGGKDEVANQLERTLEVQKQVGTANENAATKRVEDAVRLEQTKEELQDALSQAKNSDDARRRAGCVILRQQGRDLTTVAACRGL